MMDEVLIPYGKNSQETAILLLAAAEDKGYEPWVVRHQPEDGGFRVPEDVASGAKGVKAVDPEEHQADLQAEAQAEVDRQEAERADVAEAPQEQAKAAPRKQAAKKTAAKKTAAKRAPAKKAAAKKTANK